MQMNQLFRITPLCFALLANLVPAIGQSIQATGRIEGRVGLVSSQSESETDLVHMERIHFGIQQNLDFLSLNYQITWGGLYRGSRELGFTDFYPEYQARAKMVPVGHVQLELFSFSQLRNPMQISQDTIRHTEQVSGVQLESPLPGSGRIIASYGTRNASWNETERINQFYKLQLERKIMGLQFRVRGEKDLYSEGVSAQDEDRSNLSLQWYGSPIKGLSWTSLNSLYRFRGQDYWRIYQRLNYQLGTRSTLWTHIRNQQVAFRGSYLNTQGFDVDYRWKLNDKIALQGLVEGSKVRPLDGDPLYHWRAYMAGVHWRFGNSWSALGVLQSGYKESYRFGSGMSIRYELEERWPILRSRRLALEVSDYSDGEFFFRMDADQSDPRYDIDHELRMNLDLFPGSKIQVGNTIKVLNHFGTDLDFSSDTLRNAITHNIQLKFIQRRLRASLDHFTINELSEPADLRLHLNTRFSYHLSPGRSLNFVSMYRYQSDYYPNYLWLSGFIKINMQHFNWALEVQAQGDPDQVFDENLSVWMRFVRQL
jgi:hypothetical protein